eukprot:gene16755-biopygen9339
MSIRVRITALVHSPDQHVELRLAFFEAAAGWSGRQVPPDWFLYQTPGNDSSPKSLKNHDGYMRSMLGEGLRSLPGKTPDVHSALSRRLSLPPQPRHHRAFGWGKAYFPLTRQRQAPRALASFGIRRGLQRAAPSLQFGDDPAEVREEGGGVDHWLPVRLPVCRKCHYRQHRSLACCRIGQVLTLRRGIGTRGAGLPLAAGLRADMAPPIIIMH